MPFFESMTFALSCRFNGFDNDTNYGIWVTKGKYRNSSGDEIGGRVRLLGKQWLTRYFVYRGYSEYFVPLIPTECPYNHPNLAWWFETYCWGRKKNCQRSSSHRTIRVLCLQVCHGSFRGKPERHFFRGKLWYVNLFSSNFNVRYYVVLPIVKTGERRNVCFDAREQRPTTL